VAADEGNPKEPEGKQVDQQGSSLLGYLQTPIKQMQEWVSSGQLQSTIEHLQEQAERAQEGVERRLRALNEVRQGMQIHMKKQLEAYQRDKEELMRRAETAERAFPPETAAADVKPDATSKPKGRPAAKRPAAKKNRGGKHDPRRTKH
jgi:hypothetical protein